MKNWYSIQNKNEGVVDISIHDEIGLWGVSAADFIAELQQHKNATAINLSIHSPGGSVLDGFAMYNALKSHPATVHGSVEGIAASAASFVLMAANTITMPEDSFLMIHNAWGGAVGDVEELRSVADRMDKLQDSIVNIYEKRTGKAEADIRDMMNAETWMNANDALENGFIDTISDAINVAAKTDLFSKHFKTMPVNKQHSVENIETIKDFERYLRDAGGLSKGVATALASRAKAVFRSDSDNKPSEGLAEIHNAMMRMKVPESLTK